jgi:hypothetical protein
MMQSIQRLSALLYRLSLFHYRDRFSRLLRYLRAHFTTSSVELILNYIRVA